MTRTASRKLFVSLAVRDLNTSVDFFSALGFTFDPRFTDDNAACMIVSDAAYVMLLREEFFKMFTRREPCDTARCTEGMFALSCGSRGLVDDTARQALAAGGRPAMDPQDHGFLYTRSFYDPDGHHWEVFWRRTPPPPLPPGDRI